MGRTLLLIFAAWMGTAAHSSIAAVSDAARRFRAVDAAEFGLTPGSGSDQSTALAKAMQHVSTSDEVNTVRIPAGIYQFDSPIRLKPGVNLVGAGAGKSVLKMKDGGDYLLKASRVDFHDAVVTGLTFSNPRRLLLMQEVRRLQFRGVEFQGGIVRFEQSSDLILEGNVFNDNQGKSAYAGSECSNVRIANNTFNSSEKGSVNLSGHTDCHVVSNRITSRRPIDSGYAGVRLPNKARNNLVERNIIENHGRGIFILSSSERNIVRNNVVKSSTMQGIFVQSSNNRVEGNSIIDAGSEAIYVGNATAESSPTPSVAEGNLILRNVIRDTRRHDDARFVGLFVTSRRNTVRGNKVSAGHGRRFKEIKAGQENRDLLNFYTR